ncbi:GNAT family N-acetyltransferase [Demequina aurantiaca]|uniref:GNAT family N-acetyltransferase n=1 Tax=Demequina aurantiaca TaxID=676200 RepID=UPI000780C6E5|nr:GNAT family N-acetyltransferase [Demequina aurantiaca]
MPTADVSARPAVLGDEHAFAAIQLAAWRETLGDEAVDALDADEVRDTWGAAIESPPTRDDRMFAACDGPRVVGFAAMTAAGDIIALEVAPEHRRMGHGSRLMAACVDTLRIRNAPVVRAWALEGDEAREAFLQTAGLGEGGVRRTLEGPHGDLVERLWRAEV